MFVITKYILMIKPKKVSLKDIALEAGVSTALVSYVLNGKEKESRVGKEIAIKIREIAKTLNYQPNHVAKSLRSGTTKTIGLVIADISNPFFSNIARIVEDEAKRSGYTVIFGSSDENAEKSWDLFNVMINRQVDGFIIVSSEHSQKQITYLKDNDLPFVLLDRHFPEIETDFVVLNNYKAALDAGTHLISGGYHRIGMVAYESDLFHMKERIRGFLSAFDVHQVSFNPEWLQKIAFNNIEKEIGVAIDSLLRTDPAVDAIIFATYSLAINGLKYINTLGLKVPDDLAIVSFGQADALDLYYCPITYLRQPMADLGKTAVHLLVNKLKNSEEGLKQVIMEATLVARNSSKAKVTV
jgi:LacI family transcriptional regulator